LAGQLPYNEAQYVKTAFLIILNTVALPEAIYDWQRRSIVNQTWAQFKILFVNAHREYHLITAAASQTDFHQVHMAVR
jgi:hypothetical protein